LELLGM